MENATTTEKVERFDCSTPIPVYDEQLPNHSAMPYSPETAYIQPMQPEVYVHPQPMQPEKFQPPAPEYTGPTAESKNTGEPKKTVPLHTLQSIPATVECKVCGVCEMTRAEAQPGNTTHAWGAVMCFCCCLGCIPYLLGSVKDVHHFCGSCNAPLAVWHNSGRTEVLQVRRN